MKPDNLHVSKVPIPASDRQMRTQLCTLSREQGIFCIDKGYEKYIKRKGSLCNAKKNFYLRVRDRGTSR